MTIRTGDRVQVMRGRDRGKIGKVLQVLPRRQTVVVEQVRLRKRHQKAKPGRLSGIIERAAPISSSTVMLLCPHCHRPTRGKAAGQARLCHRCRKTFP